MKKFLGEVRLTLEKIEVLETEHRADLMTMFNQRLVEMNKQATQLEQVLSQMSIKKVIEQSFTLGANNRSVEKDILTTEDNQKSVNAYLIEKIHTLEDKINYRFEEEKKQMKEEREVLEGESKKQERQDKERELKGEKQHRELKGMIEEVREEVRLWST